MKDSFGGKNSGLPILFGIFSGFMFIGFIFTFLIPETKGKSLEKISDDYNKYDKDRFESRTSISESRTSTENIRETHL